MKTKNLLFLLVLIITLLFIPNTVRAGETYQDSQQVNYELDAVNKTATVVSSLSVMGDITIPETITVSGEDYTVTSIGADAFRECTGLTGITLPNTVTSIGDYAFCNCSFMTYIALPDSLEQLGNSALAYTQLAYVEIPEGVTKISDALFAGNDNLQSVTIKGNVTSIGRNAFHFCKNLMDVTIPATVTLIDFGAFSNCELLQSLTVNGSNVTIGETAFAWTGLTSLTINSEDTSIEKMAFYSCDRLEQMIVNGKITDIGTQAFDWCSIITMSGDEALPGTYAGSYAIANGWNLVPNYTATHNLENVTIENENIGNEYTATLMPSEGYVYPDDIIVSIAGTEVTTEDIYNNTTGEIYIESAKIIGDIIITASGKVKQPEPPVPTINKYDLIIDVPLEVWANVAGTISVIGGTTSNISLSANGGYAIDSIKKIIEYNNGNIVEENLEFDPKNSNLEIILPDEDINNIRLVVTARREGIENAKELQEALGGEQFATLNGNVVTLIKDVQLSDVLYCIDGEYTLDLNGHTISLTDNVNIYLVFEVMEETKLTIKDSSNGKGTINAPEGDVFIVEGKATLIINGGTYKGFYVLNAYEEAKVIINDGKFIAEEMALYFGMDSIGEINNGTFNANTYAAVGCFDNSNVSIAGGKFTSNEFAGLYVEYFYNMEPTITLTGGEFIGKETGIMVYTYVEEDGKPAEVSSLLADGYIFEANTTVEIITKEDHEFQGNYYNYVNNKEVTVKAEESEKEDAPSNGGSSEAEPEEKPDDDGNSEDKPDDNSGSVDTQTKDESNTDKVNTDTNNNTSDIPQTGDNIWLVVGIFVVSIIGVFVIAKFKRKK